MNRGLQVGRRVYLSPLVNSWPWASALTPWSLRFLIRRIGLLTVSTWWACRKGEMMWSKGSTWRLRNFSFCYCFKRGWVRREWRSLLCCTQQFWLFPYSLVRTLCVSWNTPQAFLWAGDIPASWEGTLLCGFTSLSSPTPATAAPRLLLRPTSMCRYLERPPRRPPHSHFPHFLQASAQCSLTSEALLGHRANSSAGPSPILLGFILLYTLHHQQHYVFFLLIFHLLPWKKYTYCLVVLF